jgi:allantoate deiminase
LVLPPETALSPLDDGAKADLARTAAEMLEGLRRHGGGPDGSVTRLVYSQEWAAAMAEVEGWLSGRGLETRVDAVGTRFGRLAGVGEQVVLTGSHIDSVSGGGAYDGALGVIMATCAVGWLARALGAPRRSIEVLANCEEESSRFAGNFWGARAMLGLISPAEPDSLRDAHGVTMGEAMRRCGLDPARIPEAARSDIAAFVEPHIEQGPRLEAAHTQVGVVERVVGVRQLEFRFEGSSGHAGTIPMDQRRDALVAAAELVDLVRRTALETGDGAVATVGSLDVHPGGSNQIPGDVRMTVDFRHADEAVLDAMERQLTAGGRAAHKRHSVSFATHVRLSQPPVEFDRRLQDVMMRSCEQASCSWMRLPSGAGHDAQVIARRFPAAMLFVPSRNGHSHRPEEATDIADVVAGIEVLIGTLHQLAYVAP